MISLAEASEANFCIGKPVISLKNKLESYLNDTFGKYVIHVSLTDTKLYSIASVIIEQS